MTTQDVVDNDMSNVGTERRDAEVSISESKLGLLLAISRKVGGSLDLQEVLDFIMDSVGEIIPCDAAGIHLFDSESHTVKNVFARGYSGPAQAEIPIAHLGGELAHILATGKCILASNLGENPKCLSSKGSTRSQLLVPILSDGKILGAFNLESDHPGRFNKEDLEYLTVLAAQAAISINKGILYQRLAEKNRWEEQLRIAREVQLSLLPTSAPNLPGLDIDGINIPSEGIGGDYFDFIPIVEGHLGIAVADVVGKGIPASLIMAGFRAFLRAEIRNNYAIRTIFGKVNSLLQESLKPYQFVSAFYGVLDVSRWRFTYSNAGHHPPILLRPSGCWRYLASGGPVLGILEGATYNERFVDLVPGDVLLLYTDGVVETENEAGEMFERDRLEHLVSSHASLSARELCEKVHSELTCFRGRPQPDDDTTIVVVKVQRDDVR